MSNKSLVLFGASGHAKVVHDIASTLGYSKFVIYDNDLNKQEFMGISIEHNEAELLSKRDFQIFVSIGSNVDRYKVATRFSKSSFVTLIHPQSIISTSAVVGNGTVIVPGAVVNTAVSIGRHCIINTNCSIDHESFLDDFTHVGPGAILCGNVLVATGAFIGAGAVVIPNLKIGKWSVIGAGAVVTQDVPDFAVVVGNPARIINYQHIIDLD